MERCKKCNSKEVNFDNPYTLYECGSLCYDGLPETFKQSDECRVREGKLHLLYSRIEYINKNQSERDKVEDMIKLIDETGFVLIKK